MKFSVPRLSWLSEILGEDTQTNPCERCRGSRAGEEPARFLEVPPSRGTARGVREPCGNARVEFGRRVVFCSLAETLRRQLLDP